MTWVYFSKNKSESFENFRKFKTLVEKKSESFLEVVRMNRGGAFMSNEFNHFCEENSIRRVLTAPYTAELNGVVERKNSRAVEMARSLLKAKEPPNQYWVEAIAILGYLLNISPTKAVLNQKPYKAWKGKELSKPFKNFRLYCLCFGKFTKSS